MVGVGSWMVWARVGGSPIPQEGPVTPFCLLILEYRVEAPSGRMGCSAGRGTGWTQGTWDRQPASSPSDPQAASEASTGSGGATAPQTSGLSSKHVRVGQFLFDFWLFSFHSLSFLKYP